MENANNPNLLDVAVFPQEIGLEYALHLKFDGCNAKFVFPVPKETEEVDIITYQGYEFNRTEFEKIMLVRDDRGVVGIKWTNGLFLSADFLFKHSSPFYIPRDCCEVVYEDENYKITKIKECDGELWDSRPEEDLITVIHPGGAARNYKCFGTILDDSYNRKCNMDYGYIGDSIGGKRLVYAFERGYGYIDNDCRFIIKPIYEEAEEYVGHYAKVATDAKDVASYKIIDSKGNKVDFSCSVDPKNMELHEESDGMVLFSAKSCKFDDGVYDWELEDYAGINGYMDHEGNVVVKPQYLYAFDFYNGLAAVCNGDYVEEEKQIRWTKCGKWGIIDRSGNTVIPFEYDFLSNMQKGDSFEWEPSVYFQASKDGRSGVIDRNGNWLTEKNVYLYENTRVYDERYIECCLDIEDEEIDDDWYTDNIGVYDLLAGEFLINPAYSSVYITENFILCEYERLRGKDWYKTDFYTKSGKKVATFEGNWDTYSDRPYLSLRKKVGETVFYGRLELSKIDCADIEKNGFVIDDYVEWQNRVFKDYIICGDRGSEGLAEISGKIVIPEIYDEVRLPDRYGLVIVFKGHERIVHSFTMGYLTTKGNVVLDPDKYYSIHALPNNKILTHRKDRNVSEILTVELKS